MKLLVLLVTLCFLISLSQSSVFLPTEYVPLSPISYTANMFYSLQVDLCDGQLYESCHFTATLNIPYTSWNVLSGISVGFSIIGGKDCKNVYCSNDINSSTPGTCSFFLPPNNGPTLYYVSTAGKSANIPATFNLKIDCATKGNSTVTKYQKECPFSTSPTRKNVKIEQAHSVATSATVPVVFNFVVCPTSGVNSIFKYVLTATDQTSAFASYFCLNSTTCSAGESTLNLYDASASGLNTVYGTQLKGTELAVAIYGWGTYKSANNFVFTINIQNST